MFTIKHQLNIILYIVYNQFIKYFLKNSVINDSDNSSYEIQIDFLNI